MDFSQEIEFLKTSKDINYIDAVLLFTEQKGLDIELIAETIRNDIVLVSKIQYEAENLNILKKGARLPI